LNATLQIGRSLADSTLRALLAGSIAFGALTACGDPVHDASVAALGGEAPGVPKGEFHRPGQPCTLCHSDQGGAPPFSIAGTVYIYADSLMPIEGVQVKVTDSTGRSFTTTSNCAGNFMVRPQEFTPEAPLWLNMQRDAVVRVMNTAIYREGSCAACHGDPAGPSMVGHVYLIDDPTVEKAPVSQCH